MVTNNAKKALRLWVYVANRVDANTSVLVDLTKLATWEAGAITAALQQRPCEVYLVASAGSGSNSSLQITGQAGKVLVSYLPIDQNGTAMRCRYPWTNAVFTLAVSSFGTTSIAQGVALLFEIPCP